ncbi:ubiquitin carboxyl-terminal hydrolase 40-like [Sycon ciliatum]|uniref:ubiquitin carboxyl-terminal hydrolase 40-like n=1 Tax=Sycon ciliatum TaxID=27933 RepID=UPI0031F5F7B2
MLGDLFLEADSDQPNGSIASGSNSFGAAPEKRRSPNRLSGLRNQGATCYLNSLIQTLFLTRELRDSLFGLDSAELGELDGSKEVRKIPVELRKLFARLLLKDVNSVSTGALTESFGWSGNEVVQQHDVQELNRILFTALEDSLVGTAGSQLIKTLYHGEIVNQVHCKACGSCSERHESFLDIAVPVVGCLSLSSALQSLYCEKEQLCGANQYFCERCNKKVDASKGAVLSQLPPILTVSLLRFQYDWEKGDRYKETGRFKFPDELDMAPYCLPSGAGAGDVQQIYEIFSVVVHRGGAHGGHYFAYIRDADGLGSWSEPKESSILVETDGDMELTECDSPVTVLITILSQHKKTSSAPVSIDQLCKLLQKQTGVSWNKRFKRKHGALTKFMHDHSDIFLFEADGCVSLVDGAEATSAPVNDAKQAGNGSAPDTAQTEAKASASSSSSQADASSSATAGVGSDKWFSFNDNWVSPVDKSILENTYMGKESAYMLFYRRKAGADDVHSYNHEIACNTVPLNLQCDIATENFDLDEQREAYEVATNNIAVNVHESTDFRAHCGVLQRKTNAQKQISVDRRKGFSELHAMLIQTLGHVTAVYTASPCPSGLHLLQQVPCDATSLTDYNILADSHLLVVCTDPETFLVDDLLMGEEQAPMLIRCQLPSSDGETKEVVERPFSQKTLLSEVIALFCQQNNLSLPAAATACNPKEKKPLVLTTDDGLLPIKQARLVDGSLLVFSDKAVAGGAVDVPRQTVAQWSVVVENWCNSTPSPTTTGAAEDSKREEQVGVGNWSTKCVYINDTMTVGQLKNNVIEGTSTPLNSVRLRVEHVTVLGPPLCDSDVIAQQGWPDGQQVVLERGAAPGADEMMLQFELGGSVRDGRQYEVTVHNSQTVQDCVEAMLIQSCTTGTEYHIRRTNWCGEAAEILDDPMMAIETTGVKNGDFLFLLPGLPPPPDCVRLSLYIPTASKLSSDSSDGAGQGVVSWLSSVITSSLSLGMKALNQQNGEACSHVSAGESTHSSSVDPPSADEAGTETPQEDDTKHADNSNSKPAEKPTTEKPVIEEKPFSFMTTVDVKKTAKIADLKSAILCLPVFSSGDAAIDPDRLRVRRLQDGHARRIFRQGDTMRSLKLLSGSDVLCQVLAMPEVLPQSSLILMARRRRQASRSYSQAEEIVLNTQDGCTAAQLKRCLIEHFQLSCDTSAIHCAKQLPDQFDWLPIQDSAHPRKGAVVSSASRQKKGGAAPRKPHNLRNSPVFLQDGDTVGFKLASEERTSTLKDFRTPEDMAGLRQLEAIKEEKRLARKQRRCNNSMEQGQRRPEVGIRIVVPNYQQVATNSEQ